MKFDKSIFHTSSIKFEYGISQEKKILEFIENNSTETILVLAGRSNVGKSSFINQFLKDKIAKTSKTPGRTQEINLFSFSFKSDLEKKIYLFDLPGYGYAKISKDMKKKWNKLLGFFFAALPTSATVFQIQDAKVPHQPTDIEFLDLISQTGPTSYLILNKIDKLKNQKEKAHMNKEVKVILSNYQCIQGVFQTSVTKNKGFDEFRKFIWNQISTSTL